MAIPEVYYRVAMYRVIVRKDERNLVVQWHGLPPAVPPGHGHDFSVFNPTNTPSSAARLFVSYALRYLHPWEVLVIPTEDDLVFMVAVAEPNDFDYQRKLGWR